MTLENIESQEQLIFLDSVSQSIEIVLVGTRTAIQ